MNSRSATRARARRWTPIRRASGSRRLQGWHRRVPRHGTGRDRGPLRRPAHGDQATRPQWLSEHKISVPILIAEKRSAEFPDTPTITEFVKDESTQQQLDLLMVSQG